MSASDLRALFADLRQSSLESSSANREVTSPSQSNDAATASQASANLQSQPRFPTSPSPLPSVSPSTMTYPAQDRSANKSSNSAGANTQNLLSLLNFGTSSTPKPVSYSGNNVSLNGERDSSSQYETALKTKNISASDLVARLMSPPNVNQSFQQNSPLNHEDQGGGGLGKNTGDSQSRPQPTSDTSQDALRKLLSRAQANSSHGSRSATPKERQSGSNEPEENHQPEQQDGNATQQPSITKAVSPDPQSASPVFSGFGQTSGEHSLLVNKNENRRAEERGSPFTYSNPFDALNASRNRTSKSPSPAPRSSTPVYQFGQTNESKPGEQEENLQNAPISSSNTSARKILTPRLPSLKANPSFSRDSMSKSPEPGNIKVEQDIEKSQDAKTEIQHIEEARSEPVEEARKSPAPEHQTEELAVSKDDQNGLSGEWEDVDESRDQITETRKVPVYNFPIKPFVSLTLQLQAKSEINIREDGVMEISRLKKDFDQIDRSLAAATTKYIAYALVKNGGMRVIRQDDGSDRQVFKNSHDRIFNVAFCTTAASAPPSDDQALLGTGVSGSVYYAAVSKEGNDVFEKNELESESLIFPPYPSADENSAGGVLKTRAKRSSRHPEFFGIGRGKSVHIIWPATALSTRYGVDDNSRQVDVKKFYEERTLQVLMGKAVKDFVFSEDDTVIASLDKVAKLRFWDIRKLIEESNATSTRVSAVTIDTPLLSLATTLETERMWPTSVLFVDKARPYIKGGAMRYILVGLRQNHTLQLWDIALGKAVQELNLPHETETDGLCSVAYHPNSGIIVLGHPTRNSLFFIHLSAPRYTLSSSISQATYIQRIAAKDSELPKPESTACMSGIREISFGEKGQLRSVELLPFHRPSEAPKTTDETQALFELYVVHSKGVTCLTITKEDLGWNAESKVIYPVDATKKGLLLLKELKVGYLIEESAPDRSPEVEAQPMSKSAKKKAAKKSQHNTIERSENGITDFGDSNPSVIPAEDSANNLDAHNGIVSSETPSSRDNKKSKKKTIPTPNLPPVSKSPTRTISPIKPTETAAQNFVPTEPEDIVVPSSNLPSASDEVRDKPDSVSVGISGDWLDKELKKVERGVSAEFHKELNNLYQNISNDRLVQDSSSAARYEAVLRLVSNTLTNNVEKSLSRILATQMQQIVVPAITGVTVQAVTGQVGDAVAKTLHHLIPRELSAQLPMAVNAAMSNPQMSRTISENASRMIAQQTESSLAEMLETQIVPSFKILAISAAENAASEMENRFKAELHQFEKQRHQDVSRIEKLSQVLQGMAETLQAMSDTQVAFQGQILSDRKQLALLGEHGSMSNSGQVSTAKSMSSPAPIARPTPVKPKTKEEIELEDISRLMNEGNYEEGSIKWLQSTQPVELFDNLFVRFTPEYLSTDVSPLVAFSIAITVANSLTTNTLRRLEWISAAFDAVDIRDPEISDLSQHAPALLNSLISKLESMYMTIAEHDPAEPALKMIPAVANKAKLVKNALLGHDVRSQSNVGFGNHQIGTIGL